MAVEKGVELREGSGVLEEKMDFFFWGGFFRLECASSPAPPIFIKAAVNTPPERNMINTVGFELCRKQGPSAEDQLLNLLSSRLCAALFLPPSGGGPLPADSGPFYDESVLGSGSRQPRRQQNTPQ
ncbi:hypothetical protein EYF80_051796 [Liparis tanakae]|uniref:Uncharacterized protein n=1 Tax=Liparis tanakae TaxID=230148 RepID=A0A4Z2FB58_9TELE|nr:hypothetical protein EYF80_051796 [Liparis tanakae]